MMAESEQEKHDNLVDAGLCEKAEAYADAASVLTNASEMLSDSVSSLEELIQ